MGLGEGAMSEFVIGLDSSTQSTKAIAWDRAGRALGEGRARIPMASPAPGHCEQDPEDWWRSALAALAHLGAAVDLAGARGLAISNQRETVGFLDADGRSVRPAMLWIDERAAEEAARFSAAFGADALHRISGKPVDVTPALYRLAWMRRHEPDHLDRTARIVDVQGYLTGRLTGEVATSWTSADPFGAFDVAGKVWSEEILAPIGLSPDRFAPAHRPGTRLGALTDAAAGATGLPRGLPVFAAGGDGQCAGLGVDAMRAGTAYLNLGTAIVTGAWSAEPRMGADWRTMTSPTGEGYFLEGVMRAGTYFLDWYVRGFVDEAAGPAAFAALSQAASALPVGSDGVVVSPYLSGCMNPHWEMRARAAFSGLSASHGKVHLYRAALEALTGEVARTIRAMAAQGVAIERIFAVGGGANSALWRGMIADATGLPLTVSTSVEASSLGAGMTAAVGLGWFPDFAAAAGAMSGTGETREPDPGARAAWDALIERQDRLNRFVCAEAGADSGA